MAPPRVPNFFLVGAPKAGTTSLWRYLDQHPDIFMSRLKEPAFFAPEIVDVDARAREILAEDAAALRRYLDGPMTDRRHQGFVLDWDDYLKLFAAARDERAIGEASVSYLASEGAPQAIRDRCPDARVLMMLRDPADRLFAHYRAARAARVTSESFPAWIETQQTAEAARRPCIGPIWAGRYAQHLRRYRAAFPETHIQAHLFEDYATAPAKTLTRIFSFLGVNPAQPIDLTERHNVTRPARWATLLGPFSRVVRPIAPTAAERGLALALYQDDIRELEALLHQSLAGWLAATPPAHPSQ